MKVVACKEHKYTDKQLQKQLNQQGKVKINAKQHKTYFFPFKCLTKL